ncbi:unnamed protein product [Ectocarpus sp. 12 AP-2014]
MAPDARKSRTTAVRVAALPVLLLLVGGVISSDYRKGASAASISGTSEGRGCEEEFDECIGSDVCTSCVFSFAEETSCTEYPFDPTNTCDLLGVSYCCAAEASGAECSTDGFTLNYWECALEANDCSLGDMPCLLESTSDRSVGSAVGDAEYFTSEGAPNDDPEEDLQSSGQARRGPVATTTVAAGVAAAIALALALPLH